MSKRNSPATSFIPTTNRFAGKSTPLRAAVTALARAPAATPEQPAVAALAGGEEHRRSPARYLWAMLIARIYEAFPLACPQCGTEMRIAG